MANIENPKKQFNFQIFLPAMNPFLAQKVTLPDFSADVVEHGDFNYLVKTGGINKVGTLNIEKISSALFPDSQFFNWIQTIQNAMVGSGALPSSYKTTITVEHYAPDGFTVLDRYIMEGCWPSKLNGVELSRVDSGNTMESIEMQVDRMFKNP